jgi:hypothetical protein
MLCVTPLITTAAAEARSTYVVGTELGPAAMMVPPGVRVCDPITYKDAELTEMVEEPATKYAFGKVATGA